MLSPYLFNLYAEYIMQNARLRESEAGIKIARKNINNLRHSDDTTLMAESKEKLKSLLMRVKKESGKAGLKLNIQKTEIMGSSPITSWQIDGGKNGGPKSLWTVTSALKLEGFFLERKAISNLDSILKSRDTTLPTSAHLVKAMVFLVVWM